MINQIPQPSNAVNTINSINSINSINAINTMNPMNSNNAINLLDKIKTRTARIGIIGLGYVGLPLAIEFVKAGFPVTGFDIDPEKIKLLKQGKSYIKHIDISILTNHQ